MAEKSKYDQLQEELRRNPRTWLVTGAAGFIGSNLVEMLLRLDQRVVGLDSFATGHRANLDHVKSLVTSEQWTRFRFIEGDIRQVDDCQRACAGADYVLHQAALGSVPRSIEDPLRSHAANVDGFINMLIAARDARVQRFVYASSSSVYGDHPGLPKQEANIGRMLSPYAATKWINEIYADVFHRSYGLKATGLRYFNVFGPRQDPAGAYAAVIPKWFAALFRGERVHINGDGETSRDFCHISNVVQANLLAAIVDRPQPTLDAYNIAVGDRTTLNELYRLIRQLVVERVPSVAAFEPVYGAERAGDVRHSLADIGRARAELGYAPTTDVKTGLKLAAEWYATQSVVATAPIS